MSEENEKRKNYKCWVINYWNVSESIKLIVFDLDQTLIDSIRRFYVIFNKILKKLCNYVVSWDVFFEHFWKDTLDDLISEGVNATHFWKEFRRAYAEEPIHPSDKIIPGALETLRWLKERGYKIVVTTGREVPEEKIWEELLYFGLNKYVDKVYTLASQDPSVEDLVFIRTGVLELIMRDFKVKPEEILFIGDYWVDMESCRRLGILGIGVLTGHESEEKLRKFGAKYVLRSVKELPKLLTELENVRG